MSDFKYVGGELELFAQAQRWKAYWSSQLRPYLRGAVAEIGAGVGANTVTLRTGTERRWVCVEPDAQLCAELKDRIAEFSPCRGTEVVCGTIAGLPKGETFDALLYLDVLEHIPADREELQLAAQCLSSTGRVIVLAPAHQWLFSPFDKAIGHYRRYNAPQLAALTPPALQLEKSFYLDSVGLLASAANRLLLQQSLPTTRQIQFWDRYLVPCSRLLDPLLGHRVGKSVVAVWRKAKTGPNA